MNGFEPLRRRIIDYTATGQWSVAYDGPIEGCETEQLKVENAKLRELVRFANKTVEGLCELVENSPGCSMCPLNQDEDRACGAAELFSRMLELGVNA